METLQGLLAYLGSPVLGILAAPRGLNIELARLVVVDPTDLSAIESGAVVVGIGFGPGDVARLLAAVGAAGAPVLIVKACDGVADHIAYAEEAGVALLTVPSATAWAQVILLVSSVLSRGRMGSAGDALAGADPGDLFAVANAIADLIEAPITIEDTASRLIAFSSRQEATDASRIATILGRASPRETLKEQRRDGVFRHLAEAKGPVYYKHPEHKLRAAIAVRAGGEVLGSIWAVVSEQLAPDREQDLINAAGFVSLHLLRHQLASGALGGIEAELAAAVLNGGSLAADAVRRLGLAGDGFRVVAASWRSEPSESLSLALASWRDRLALQLATSERRPATAMLAGVLYAIVPATSDEDSSRGQLRRQVEALVRRPSPSVPAELIVGIGAHAASIEEVPASRQTADQTLRVLRAGAGTQVVAEFDEVQARAIVLQFTDAHASNPAMKCGAIGRLLEHDARHRTAYTATLAAYFEAFGDPYAAAETLGVHANTVRYRVGKLTTLAGIRLENPTERLALMLQLRALGH